MRKLREQCEDPSDTPAFEELHLGGLGLGFGFGDLGLSFVSGSGASLRSHGGAWRTVGALRAGFSTSASGKLSFWCRASVRHCVSEVVRPCQTPKP